MGGKERIFNRVLTAAVILSALSCTGTYVPEESKTISMELHLCGCGYQTRADDHSESVHDINIIIFEDGVADSMIWTEPDGEGTADKMSVSLLDGHIYTVFAVANIGRELEVKRMSDLSEEYLCLRSAEDIEESMPMTAWANDIVAEEGGIVRLEFIRLAARISIDMDRSMLNEDVSMKVAGVRTGNCPGRARLAGTNRIESREDCLRPEYGLKERECAPLNVEGEKGMSGKVDLYMLENMQGQFPVEIHEAEEKVFAEGDPMADKCSYVEMEIEYTSDSLISYDSNLLYRFYLGDGLNSLDVERNCHYHITVTPVGDGLSGGGWRVDKSGTGPSTPVFAMYPEGYVEGKVGDVISIRCEYYPRSAPFDPGIEELEFDKNRGIHDYQVDMDGKAVSLTLLSPGTAIVYMSAGHPVNQSGMVIIAVYP